MSQIFWSLLLAASMSPAQEKDNPRYEYWANCKVGSWVTYKMTGGADAQKFDITVTEKLLELTPEKAVVETAMKMTSAGKSFDVPAQKQDVKAKDDKGAMVLGEKDEDVEVAGKKVKCRVLEYEAETGKDKIVGKAWMTKEIPGGAAKGEFTSEKAKTTFKTEALEWEKK